ncbi:MAG: ABC transporter ATP-binding protein [Pseudomonadota bacterium]|nr:ABC transporter ATP-binding protein [Pseudomonadota bacterium]
MTTEGEPGPVATPNADSESVSLPRPLLSVDRLALALPRGADRPFAVEDVSFQVREDEIVCLVGESGSGKSMTAHAVLRLLPPMVQVAGGRVLFRGTDLLGLGQSELRRVRGGRIAMIFQEPLSALNPLQRVGTQISESLEVHQPDSGSKAERRARMLDLLDSVGLPDPKSLAQSYPFQLSGGQRQRVMIAMALANGPDLLLADEPTTALDVTTQRQILDLIQQLRRDRRMGVLFITHDFGVVADIADRVLVMRTGRIVEEGHGAALLRAPKHPYTRALIDSVPGTHARRTAASPQGPNLLDVEDLRKTFVSRQGLFAPARRVVAADGVSLGVRAGETVAVVGESGSGKSTLGRMILRLIEPDRGAVRFEGTDVLALRGEALRQYRRHVQIVFQDPFASLNPRQKVGAAIARGPIAFGTPRATALGEARRLLQRVGLDPAAADRYPHEFSGGQRQRISIARALALRPKLLVADEPVSALDVSVQAQVLALLADLKREFGLAMLFITHDLRVAAEISDTILVMRHGRIVERNATAALFAAPAHAYTRELLDAVPGRGLFVRAHQPEMGA